MKLIWKAALPLVLAAASLLSYGALKHRFKPVVSRVIVTLPKPITAGQRATHRISMVDDEGHSQGRCTATAIGPHALLTAKHCNEGPDAASILNIDLSRRKYHILAQSEDGVDHLILIVDGPEFTNTVKIDADPKVVSETETLHLYGCGRGMYPCRELRGTIQPRIHDLSDVDAYDGLLYMTMKPVPGDSGSAIYTESGRIVAITTYYYAYPLTGDPDSTKTSDYLEGSANFKLKFTDIQIKNAEKGIGDKATPKPKENKKGPLSLFIA